MSIANVMAGIARISRVKRIEDMRFNPVPIGEAEYLSHTMTNNVRFRKLLEPAIEIVLSQALKQKNSMRS